jgi:hypothetical protein
MHPIQIKIFQNMSAQRKWELSIELNYNARALKAAALRKDHPEWNEEKVNEEVKKIFINAST